MRIFIILISIICLFALVSCNEGKNSTEVSENSATGEKNKENTNNKIVEWNNTHCPVMEGKVKEDGGSTMYQGKLVRFCCPQCIKKFNNNPEEYHETLISYSSGEKSNSDSEHDHNHDHSDH